jgi:hypothetical protein
MSDGTEEDGAYAARIDEWVACETTDGAPLRAGVDCIFFVRSILTLLAIKCLEEGLEPRDMRTAHRRGRRISEVVVVDRPREGYWTSPLFFRGRLTVVHG